MKKRLIMFTSVLTLLFVIFSCNKNTTPDNARVNKEIKLPGLLIGKLDDNKGMLSV